MIVVMAVIIMGMGAAAILDRDQIDLAEMHAPLCHRLRRQAGEGAASHAGIRFALPIRAPEREPGCRA